MSAFLKFTVNPRDEIAFKRVIKILPGIGPKSAEALWSQANSKLEGRHNLALLRELRPPSKAQHAWHQLVHTFEISAPGGGMAGPSAMIESVAFAIYDDYMKSKFANYEARREDIGTLSAFARQFDSTEDFLAQLALLGAVETADSFSRGVRFRKDHAFKHPPGKGARMEGGFSHLARRRECSPSARSAESREGLEEERRLFYVGLTRCKDELYVTYPEMRLNAGYGDAFQRPSRFLSEIPESLFESWEISRARTGAK